MSLENFQSLSKEEQDIILNSPALQSPEGVIPNFEHPPNRNGIAHSVTALCLILTTAAVLTRVYSRIVCVKKIEIEDGESSTNSVHRLHLLTKPFHNSVSTRSLRHFSWMHRLQLLDNGGRRSLCASMGCSDKRHIVTFICKLGDMPLQGGQLANYR